MTLKTNFQLVSAMNAAFSNPKGDPANIDWDRVRNQSLNIADEFGELMIALGADKTVIEAMVSNLKWAAKKVVNPVNPLQVRDSLGDINVFSYGAWHFMGIDGDRDMRSIVGGVMTRFVKDQDDLQATMAMHAKKGVVQTYMQGEFPTLVLKSSVDQPDAPAGKFLKSASFKEPVFYDPLSIPQTPMHPHTSFEAKGL